MRRHRESALGRLGLIGLFALVPRLYFKIISNLPPDLRDVPHTYYAISHKRDADAMAPVPTVLGHLGWHALTHGVHFATRADGFAPGFLSRLVMRPRWFSFLLRPISVGAILRGVGVHPLHGLHLRPLEMWIREWLATEGDRSVAEVLSAEVIADVSAVAHEPPERLAARPLSQLLRWRYQPGLQRLTGYEIFADRARRPAVRNAIPDIEAQIGELAAALHAGHSLYTAPEGRLSPDGRLSPIPGYLARLLEMAPEDTRVVPMTIAYDFLTTGRTRIFLDAAPAIEQGARFSHRELAEQLRAGWLAAMRFTCTQLATGVILARAGEPGDAATWTVDEVAQAVATRARALAAQGRNVDPALLRLAGARRRVASYMRALARRKLARRLPQGRWMLTKQPGPIQLAPGEVGYNLEPLTYAWNELQDMLAATPTAAIGVAAQPTGPLPRADGA